MKDLKKNLATLGLASTILFNTVGCASSQSKPVDDYYLVYLDDTFYLTKKNDCSLKNNGERVYYSYFVDTESYRTVGYLYEPIVGDNYTEYNPGHGKYDVQPIVDYNYCDGKYGYGNLLPTASVIPLTNVLSANELLSKNYDYLMSNKDELHKKIKDSNAFNSVQIVDYYEWYSNYTNPNKFKHETGEFRYNSSGRVYMKYRTENFKIYICETKEGDRDILLGYRCSFNNVDSGYDQVYNILDGSIIYIGSNREDSYVSVKEYDYENTNNLTLEEIYDKVQKEGEEFLNGINDKSDAPNSFTQQQGTLNGQSVVEDEKERSYCTKDYSLIYLNNNYYLTRFEDAESWDLYGDYTLEGKGRKISIRSYFDVQTDAFIGNQLYLGPSSLVNVEEAEINHRSVKYYNYDSQYYDYEIFAGKYGYGALLPRYSIIPLSNLVKSEFFTQEQFDFFSSNSEELANRVKASIVWNKVSYVSSYQYNYYPAALCSTQLLDSTEKKNMSLSKYVCEKTDGQFDIFYGYRCSHNKKDVGNEYIYDIFDGNIIYIGKNKEDSYVNVVESTYDNSDNLPANVLYDKVSKDKIDVLGNKEDTGTSLDESNPLTESIVNSNQPTDIVNNNLKVRTDINFGKSLTASDILIIDTSKIEATSDADYFELSENCERFYFLDNTQKETPNGDLEYLDLFNVGNAYISKSLNYVNYVGFDRSDYCVSIDLIPSLSSKGTLPIFRINDYLSMIGRDDLVKDEYTLEEISEIRNVTLGINKTRKLELNN